MLALMLAVDLIITIFVLVPQVLMKSAVAPTAYSLVMSVLMHFIQIIVTVIVPVFKIVVLPIMAIVAPIGVVAISGVAITIATRPNADRKAIARRGRSRHQCNDGGGTEQ